MCSVDHILLSVSFMGLWWLGLSQNSYVLISVQEEMRMQGWRWRQCDSELVILKTTQFSFIPRIATILLPVPRRSQWQLSWMLFWWLRVRKQSGRGWNVASRLNYAYLTLRDDFNDALVQSVGGLCMTNQKFRRSGKKVWFFKWVPSGQLIGISLFFPFSVFFCSYPHW